MTIKQKFIAFWLSRWIYPYLVEFINNIKEVDNVQKIKLAVKIVLKFSKNVEEESKCY